MSKNETVRLGGNTYPHRQEIKAIGGRWDAEANVWVVEAGSMRMRGQQSAVIARLCRQGVVAL